MIEPTKILPPNYEKNSSVTLHSSGDMGAMLVWSIILLAIPIPLIFLVLPGRRVNEVLFQIYTPLDALILLGGLVGVTIVMMILHEGLHGLVFWTITNEKPKFAFKWYYASACAEGWYLPRKPFLTATLLPLAAITIIGLVLLPVLSFWPRLLVIFLIVFNSSGCAGDMVVALRLLRLPKETLSYDKGDEVHFFVPVENP